jgi:predicted Fe-Mo cluster-binding NifX family protein
MKICFPVNQNQGLESRVFNHFGSAPMFLIVDADSRTVAEVVNRDLNHPHGACRPLRAMGGQVVDAIAVGGIGAGALSGLKQAGLRVYQAQAGTVAENLERLAAQELQELTLQQVCGGHGHQCGGGDDDLPQFGCGF